MSGPAFESMADEKDGWPKEQPCRCHWGIQRWSMGIYKYICTCDPNALVDQNGMFAREVVHSGSSRREVKDRSDCCYIACCGTMESCCRPCCLPCALAGQLLCLPFILCCCSPASGPFVVKTDYIGFYQPTQAASTATYPTDSNSNLTHEAGMAYLRRQQEEQAAAAREEQRRAAELARLQQITAQQRAWAKQFQR